MICGLKSLRCILPKMRNSHLFVGVHNYILKKMKDMRSGTQTIKRLRGDCWYLCLLILWSDIFSYLLLEKSGKLCRHPFMMEHMNYTSSLWIKKPFLPNKMTHLSPPTRELIKKFCELDQWEGCQVLLQVYSMTKGAHLSC